MPKNSYIPYLMNKISFTPLYPQIQWIPSVSRMILCIQYIHSSYVWKWVLMWRRWLHYSCSGSTNKHDFAHLKKKWIHIGMWSRKTLCFGMQDEIVSFSFLTFSFSFAWMDGWMSVPHNNATCLTGRPYYWGTYSNNYPGLCVWRRFIVWMLE